MMEFMLEWCTVRTGAGVAFVHFFSFCFNSAPHQEKRNANGPLVGVLHCSRCLVPIPEIEILTPSRKDRRWTSAGLESVGPEERRRVSEAPAMDSWVKRMSPGPINLASLRSSRRVANSTYSSSLKNITEAIESVKTGSFDVDPSEVKFLNVLGEGTMAIVYKASVRGNFCAAKRLKVGTATDSQEYRDLVTELDTLASIGRHPNLVRFFGACITDYNNPVILMELMEGPDLQTFLTMFPPGFQLQRCTIYSWSLDMLKGLDHLHNRDPIIMHRDLKPGNMMLTADLNTLKLTDFGMSKKVAQQDRGRSLHKGHTGTLRYMAPEVIDAGLRPYTEKADLFSASLVIWYFLTGLAPDIRTTSESNPPSYVKAKIRWVEVADLLLQMWECPEQRPSAGQCVDYLLKIPGPPDLSRGAVPPQVTCARCCITQ